MLLSSLTSVKSTGCLAVDDNDEEDDNELQQGDEDIERNGAIISIE
jgi:hypothetical protein